MISTMRSILIILKISALGIEADNQHKTLDFIIYYSDYIEVYIFSYENCRLNTSIYGGYMEIKKKIALRNDIVVAAKIYSAYLAGHSFLYVFGTEYFELFFPTDRFLHLTGVNTKLPTKLFYQNGKKEKLLINQIFFDSRHLYGVSINKLNCLTKWPDLTNKKVLIIKGLDTASFVYKLSLTNLEFTLGLIEKKDCDDIIIRDQYVPMSLRTKTNHIDNYQDTYFVDFIFSKDLRNYKYDSLLVKDDNKTIPNSISHLIDESFYEKIKNQCD